MNSKLFSNFLLVMAIICPTKSLDSPRSNINEAFFTQDVLNEFKQPRITKEFKNNLMRKRALKVLLELFNHTKDDAFSILPERKTHDFYGNSPGRLNLRYNTSGLNLAINKLRSCELRLYKRPIIKDKMNYIIRLYRSGEWDSEEIDSKVIPGDHEGWITMNVTRTLTSWGNYESFHYGFYLMARSLVDNIETDVRDIGIVGIEDQEVEPFLLGFFEREDGPMIPLPDSKIFPHSSDNFGVHSRLPGASSRRHGRDTYEIMDVCMPRPWFVMYDEIELDNIIEPAGGWWANYCSGRCVMANVKNQHALFQAMVNLKKPYIVPELHCVPTEYSSVDFLYYSTNDLILKRSVPEMCVKSCGCA